jgi:hypothetical protein
MPDPASAALGVYKPRRPRASPLFPLVSDHRHRLQTVYDDRFARAYGPWRPVVAPVADQFLACGVLDHGFARIRCDACTHEYLLAFSCKCRDFCPSCHAKRLAIWTQWLDTTLLAPVPHRHVVLTIPKRLRAYGLYHRLLGEIARVAAHTVTAAIRTLTGERDLAVGIVACVQTHGSRANGHPHRHLLVTDGGFRQDGTFVSWPAHDTVRLTEAFRRAVRRLLVRLELFDEERAAGMLTWPHSGCHVHTAVWVPEDDRALATRLARYRARNPVALERLTYDRTAKAVTYRSAKSAGHAPAGGADRSRRAAGARPRTTAGPDRGVPPVGDPASAALRRRPARMSHRPRHNAERRRHHPDVGERSDPHLPPRPPGADGLRRPRVTHPDRRPNTREAHRRGGGRADPRSPVLARQRTRVHTPATPIEFPIEMRGDRSRAHQAIDGPADARAGDSGRW